MTSETQNITTELYDYLVRRSDLDDVDILLKDITHDEAERLNLLFDYPSMLRLFEKSFISVTILDRNHKIVGAACFNDSPPGFKGKIDFVHENLWENWLFQAYDTQEIEINSYNTLWLTYMFVAEQAKSDYDTIIERVFQNIYAFLPQISGILFLKRGEVIGYEDPEMTVLQTVNSHFIKLKCTNPEILKKTIGVSYKSEVFYSSKFQVTEMLDIRMAREEDHDDLAEIFNKQSEVLTSQFGEFFIADLIATQNLTRRITKGSKSEGKAIVGQVKDKAVGLMSISTEIDYKLLNNCFELGVYDNLLKPELTEAITARYRQIELQKKWAAEDEREGKLKQVNQQRMKCLKVGQRILLQQHCCDKELEIKMEIEAFMSNEEQVKTLNKNSFLEMVDRWMKLHTLKIPSSIFQEFPEYARDLSTYVITSTEFLLETLELFGLPKHYIYGNGHWKGWAEKILEERKTAQLRRPQKKVSKKTGKIGKKGKDNMSQDDELRPPSYFDMAPFIQAFAKFVSVGPEVRTIFRHELEEKMKKVVMLFCDENGVMIEESTVDLMTLGKAMNDVDISVSQQISENMYSIFQAFGDLVYEQKTIQVIAKEEEDPKKRNPTKKTDTNEPPKMVEVVQKLTNYKAFNSALETIREFDLALAKLGFTKSPRLASEAKELTDAENAQKNAKLAKRQKTPDYGVYENEVKTLNLGDLPQTIPYDAQNAIVINLFCADEIYESRSLDFVDYAFNLFPERDYIILTQPFTVPESMMLQNFIQVPKKKNSTFEHCLYILHRDSLYASSLKIRRAIQSDIAKIQPLLANMLNIDKIKQDISNSVTKANSPLVSFAVECGTDLVGMYVVSKNVNLDYYVSHFFVQDHIILKEHPRENHSKLIHAILNPLFTKSVRFILKEIMRLMNKTCLYFEVHQRTLLPDIFHELVMVRARVFPHFLKRKWDIQISPEQQQRRLKVKNAVDAERDPLDQEEPPFSLSMITKKMLSSNKISNNSRIVIVGASDTGLSFIESLLMIKEVNFTNITLLAPGGLTTMHVKNPYDLLKAMSTNYTLEELRNMMIDARTTVLDAKMVKLEKKNKRIMIDKFQYLPYDILIMAVGLIDTQLQNQGLISYGLATSPYYQDKKFIPGVYSIDDPYLYRDFAVESKNIALLKRKKKPQSITVFGRTPHTVAFISGLLHRGVSPNRIFFVTPNPTHLRNRTFSSNTERLAYEDTLINDPDTFEDPNVEKMVFEELERLGVTVHLGYDFHEIVGSPCTGVRFRRKADNYDQLEEMIKEKRIEIQMKLQEMGNKVVEDIDQEDQETEEKISPEKEIELLQQQQYIQIQTPAAFFVTSGLIDIDKEIFNIIHQNGLVYNGRLIVKSNFQTTENEIFACGKICEFSQRYKNYSIGKSPRLDKYNGRELGSILSKHVLDKLDLAYLTTQKYTEDNLPKLYMPVGTGGALLNRMVYYHIKKIDHSQPKVVYEKQKEQGKHHKEVMSNNIKNFEGHYIRFVIDNNGLIDNVSYLGSEQVVVQSLMSFVGLSIKYLNRLVGRYEHGLIPNISEFLSQNWAICLYHELFSEFRHYIKNEILSNPVAERIMNRASERANEGEWMDDSFLTEIKSIIPADLFRQIKQGTLEFVSRNTNHLPMYYIPEPQIDAR